MPPQFAPNGHYGQPPRPPLTHEYQQTQTIKNQVNLRKKTLRLQPVAESSTEFRLQFNFDASTPCRVSSFLLATEDPRQSCRIIAAAPEPRPPAYYAKGVSGVQANVLHSVPAVCCQPAAAVQRISPV